MLAHQAQLFRRNPHLLVKLQAAQQREMASVQSTSVRSEEEQGGFDYAETVDTTSSLSTPNSSSLWDTSNPFSKDSLGDTVIHLDKVLLVVINSPRKLSVNHCLHHFCRFCK